MEPRTHRGKNGRKATPALHSRQVGPGKEPSGHEAGEHLVQAEERLEEVQETVSLAMHRWPMLTIAATAAIGLAAAALVGVGEAAVAGAAGYAAYRWLGRGRRRQKGSSEPGSGPSASLSQQGPAAANGAR